MTSRTFSKPTLPKATVRKYSDNPNAAADTKASSSVPMTMKVAPNEYARLAAQNISSASAKNIGRNRHPRSGSASSAVQAAPMSELAFLSTMAERFAGFMSENVALVVAFWAASPDGTLLFSFPATAATGLKCAITGSECN